LLLAMAYSYSDFFIFPPIKNYKKNYILLAIKPIKYIFYIKLIYITETYEQ